MITYETIRDKTVAMLVWNAGKQDDARIFCGKIIEHERGLLFTDEAGNWRITITGEIYKRIKPVPAGLERIFKNVRFAFEMIMDALPEPKEVDFVDTGLKWK
jgi:hypothetical protein